MPKIPPLERYAFDKTLTPSPVMRDLASIALAKGHNQQTLASAMNFSVPAVIKHFRSPNPRWETVEHYARSLSRVGTPVPLEYLGLLFEPPKPLGQSDKRRWWAELFRILELDESRLQQYKPGTMRDLKAALKKKSDQQLNAALELYIVATARQRLRVAKVFLPGAALEKFIPYDSVEIFEDAIAPFFDLKSRRWKTQPGETFFFELALSSLGVLTALETLRLIESTEFMLKARGVDTRPMRVYLRASELYIKHLREFDVPQPTITELLRKGNPKK